MMDYSGNHKGQEMFILDDRCQVSGIDGDLPLGYVKKSSWFLKSVGVVEQQGSNLPSIVLATDVQHARLWK
ncbi:hypothetical protein RSOLAG1IB_03782 [Rhizoctonia solani AG-1 IB]|uniref:Uncharacterized protein n=1 Tax=Thanatephorus cucumeris (strain AG1-IB / isolate 7/3/14) TaxID=1108050 RepID=A0A0B7FUD3_THACB|nr:hypothetical protein RSOLAG1IB_03782 [Rhizoctonia solani AG-1 IB]